MQSPTGLQTLFEYNALGLVSRISSGDSLGYRTTRLTHHPIGSAGAGQLASITNDLNQVTRFAYDAAGRISSQSLPDGRSISYRYDAHGNLSELGTPAGVRHSFGYTPKDLPASYVAPDSGATHWHYDRDRLLLSVQRPGGQTLRLAREPSGRLSTISDQQGRRIAYGWQPDGRIASLSAASQALAFSYHGGLAQGVGFALDGISASLALVPERNANYVRSRPAQLRLGVGGGSGSAVIELRYNADGQPVRMGELAISRDPASGQITALNHGVLTESRSHNLWGELSSQSVASTGAGYLDPAASKGAALALAAELRQRIDDEIMRRGHCLANVRESTTALPASPRQRHRASVEPSEPLPPEVPGIPLTNACLKQLNDLYTRLTNYIQGDRPSIAQETLQHLASVFAGGAAAIVPDYAQPNPAPPQYGADLLTAQAHVSRQRLSSLLDQWQQNAFNWQTAFSQTHQRDPLGRISQSDEVLLGLPQPSKRYTYDSAGRLASFSSTGISTGWQYDANGNRTHENNQLIASYDSQDRLLTYKANRYTHTPAGDLASKTTPTGSTHYQYDSWGNLRQVKLPDGRQIDYAIDPLNRRAGKSINGQKQWHLIWLDGLRPLARLKGDGSIDQIYYYGDKPNVPEAMLRAANKTMSMLANI